MSLSLARARSLSPSTAQASFSSRQTNFTHFGLQPRTQAAGGGGQEEVREGREVCQKVNNLVCVLNRHVHSMRAERGFCVLIIKTTTLRQRRHVDTEFPMSPSPPRPPPPAPPHTHIPTPCFFFGILVVAAYWMHRLCRSLVLRHLLIEPDTLRGVILTDLWSSIDCQ